MRGWVSLIIISQEMSHHITRRGEQNASCNYYTSILRTTVHGVQTSHGRGPSHRGSFDFSIIPLSFHFIPTWPWVFRTSAALALSEAKLCTSDIYTHFTGAIIHK